MQQPLLLIPACPKPQQLPQNIIQDRDGDEGDKKEGKQHHRPTRGNHADNFPLPVFLSRRGRVCELYVRPYACSKRNCMSRPGLVIQNQQKINTRVFCRSLSPRSLTVALCRRTCYPLSDRPSMSATRHCSSCRICSRAQGLRHGPTSISHSEPSHVHNLQKHDFLTMWQRWAHMNRFCGSRSKSSWMGSLNCQL